LIVNVSLAFAQTVTTDAPPEPITWWHKMLDIIIPFAMTFGGPYISTFFKTAPPWVKYLISSIVGILVGAGAGEYTSFPMNTDTGAASGLTLGMTGQRLLQSMPHATPRALVTDVATETAKT
jgi:hypothetical protein